MALLFLLSLRPYFASPASFASYTQKKHTNMVKSSARAAANLRKKRPMRALQAQMTKVATAIATMSEKMATKEQMAEMATKNQMAEMAKKNQMAVMGLKTQMKKQVAKLATKNQMAEMEQRLADEIQESAAVRSEIAHVPSSVVNLVKIWPANSKGKRTFAFQHRESPPTGIDFTLVTAMQTLAAGRAEACRRALHFVTMEGSGGGPMERCPTGPS
jgi:hypothetical protein